VPTLNTDWWNYGGLTREVTLVEVPNTFIQMAASPVRTSMFIDFNLNKPADSQESHVSGFAQSSNQTLRSAGALAVWDCLVYKRSAATSQCWFNFANAVPFVLGKYQTLSILLSLIRLMSRARDLTFN